jgi:hypothetical protein
MTMTLDETIQKLIDLAKSLREMMEIVPSRTRY